MTKIGNAAQLAALRQLQISTRLASTGSSQAAQDPHGSTVQQRITGSPSETKTDSPVPAQLLLAIRELQGTGIALHTSAFRIFLRHNLVKELGATTSADSTLETLLDEVLNLMESDHSLKDSILNAGKRLVDLSRQPLD